MQPQSFSQANIFNQQINQYYPTSFPVYTNYHSQMADYNYQYQNYIQYGSQLFPPLISYNYLQPFPIRTQYNNNAVQYLNRQEYPNLNNYQNSQISNYKSYLKKGK